VAALTTAAVPTPATTTLWEEAVCGLSFCCCSAAAAVATTTAVEIFWVAAITAAAAGLSGFS